jgi:hypothetical protein
MHDATVNRMAVVLPVCLLTLALAWSSAMALDLGEWVPGLKGTSFLSERVDYETNVFQVPSHSQGDAVFKTIPGFLADYTFGPHSLSAGYRAEILRWVSLTSQDTVHHIGVVQLRLDFPRTLFNVLDNVARTSDPPNSELTGRLLSLTNVLAPASEYRLSDRFSVGAKYSWTHVSFDDRAVGQDLDRNEHQIGGSLFWKVLPRTDLALSYSYTREIFILATDRDVSNQAITVGLRGDLTAKLSSTFRIGYLRRDPDSSNQPGFSGLTMGGSWLYTPTDRTTISLNTDRSTQESTFGNVPYYITTSAALAVSHQFYSKLTASARVSAGLNDYPSKQTVDGESKFRSDTFFGYGISFEYAIQPWITVGAEYARTGRRSNFNTFDFVDDKFTAKATLQF